LNLIVVHLVDVKEVTVVPDEQRLLHSMLNNYDTASRPVFNASHTVVVKFGLTLAQISDMVNFLDNALLLK